MTRLTKVYNSEFYQTEYYYPNGMIAIIIVNDTNGNKTSYSLCSNEDGDDFKTEDYPDAFIFNLDGQEREIMYSKNDKMHRENGPAYIRYNQDGTIKKQNYYLHNKLYTDKDIINNWTEFSKNMKKLEVIPVKDDNLERDQKTLDEMWKSYPNAPLRSSDIKPTDVEYFFVANGLNDDILFSPFIINDSGKVYYNDQFQYHFADYTKDSVEKLDNSDFWNLIEKANCSKELIIKIKQIIKDEEEDIIPDLDGINFQNNEKYRK